MRFFRIAVLGLIMGMIGFMAEKADAATLNVDWSGAGDYITIQEAIDAVVEGDSIQIAPGHYQEQLILENLVDISFLGSGVGTTFIDSPDTLTQSIDLNGYPQYPAVLIYQCEFIGFSNLTLDGRSQGLANIPFHGFGYFDSGGSLENLEIIHFREEPLGFNYHGNGVFAVDLTGDGRELNMNNVQVSDFQKTGVLLHGYDLKSISTNVIITGQGPVVAPSQNGWQVSGQAELTATDCSASNMFFLPSTYVATGMLGTEDTKMNLTNCDFDGCEVSVYGIGNTTTYTNGTIINPGLAGIVGKSFISKSGMDEPTAQPVVLGENFNKSDGSLAMYLADLTIIGVDAGNSWGVALLSDNQAHMELDNLTVSHFAMGMVAYEGLGDVTGTARNCTFFDNYPLAAYSNTVVEFDARFNNWGDPSGPFNRFTNPDGLGNEVFGSVNYSPFAGGGSLVLTSTSDEPVACGEPVLYTVSYEAGESTPELFLYNIEIRGGEGLVRPVNPVSLNPWGGGAELFMSFDTGDSSITVTGATNGGDPYPLAGPGTYDLFTIEISAAADSGGIVFLENATLRDPQNVTIPSSVSRSALFADCAPPAPVSEITATTDHNRIELSWMHDAVGVDHYEIYSGLWHDGSHVSVYPEYDDMAGNTKPTRPVNYADITDNLLGEWMHIGDTAALTHEQTWSDSSKRGVYYYEVFAVDAVGNVSAVSAFNDRATNYWLGDVAGLDGLVDVLDISVLDASFGESDGDDNYNNFCDYGPTDTGEPTGIPQTDDTVGFEDLMIVAMNFGVVSDAGKSQKDLSGFADLAWIEVGEDLYALRLVGGEDIKGLHVQANLPEGSFAVTEGSLLDQQEELTFLRNVGPSLDVSVAIMGSGIGFDGQGDLLLVSSAQTIEASDLEITVRGHDNSDFVFSLNELSGVMDPRTFDLKANHPNPFNPRTTISFSLPEAQDVLLKVFSVDGRCVATLVNESRAAGVHEVTWTGRNDAGQTVASGTYFYSIKAGPHTQVHKMTLMK